MTMKKKILTILSVVLILGMASLGILAYLQSEDSDVNVMTLGEVKIDQTEWQWDNGELEEFQDFKPLYPYTGTMGWENANNPEWRKFTMNNVVDKYVTVKNTGKSDAYVRTFIALEMGDYTEAEFDMVGVSINSENGSEYKFPGTWMWTDEYVKNIDGQNYYVMVAVHRNALKPGEETIPSLLQVYLKNTATNETVEKLDGNDSGTYEILVFSEAVQTAGFTNEITTTYAAKAEKTAAEVALDTAFGVPSEGYAPWSVAAVVPEAVSSPQELKDAMLIRGAKITLTEDIIVDANTPLQWGAYMFVANGREVTIDLNGHDIFVEEDALLKTKAVFTTANGGTLNIVGEGTVEVKNGKSGIFHAMNKNDQINVYGGTYISNSNNGSDALAIIYTNSGNVDVYGGKFIPLDEIECANAEDKQGNRLSVVFHEGTLLKHNKYHKGDATRIQLAEDCVLQEVVIDGATWYEVTK